MEATTQTDDKFQCRRCRTHLFGVRDLSEGHTLQPACSHWFVRDDEIIPWIACSINEANWTEGKLYCPKCEARVGAFDFLHLVPCGCQQSTQPAIYFVKSKVDHLWPRSVGRVNFVGGRDEGKDGLPSVSDPRAASEQGAGGGSVSNDVSTSTPPFVSMACPSDLPAPHQNVPSASCGMTGSPLLGAELPDVTRSTIEGDVPEPPIKDEYEILDDPTALEFEGLLDSSGGAASNPDMLNFGTVEVEETSFIVDPLSSDEPCAMGDQACCPKNACDNFVGCSDLCRSGASGGSCSVANDLNGGARAAPVDANKIPFSKPSRVRDTTTCAGLSYDDIRAFNLSGDVADGGSVDGGRGIPLQPCSRKAFYKSHRSRPHVLACQSCQDSYSSLLTREFNASLRANPYLLQDDFVNISGDFGVDQSSDYFTQSTSFTHDLAASDDMDRDAAIMPDVLPVAGGRAECTCDLSCLDAPVWPEDEIHHELRQVQRELINLQGMIHQEMRTNPAAGGMRRRRRTRECHSASRRHVAVRDVTACSVHPGRGRTHWRGCACSEISPDHKCACTTDELVFEKQDVDVHVPDRFMCSVCLDLLYDPHMTACQHVFCSPCLRQLHSATRRRPLCPLCRQRIYYVNPRLDIQDEVKRLYPELHRQRSVVEARRPVQNWPLPTFTNVRFVDEDMTHRVQRYSTMVRAFNIIRASLFMLVLLISYFLSGEERLEPRRLARNIRIFFYVSIGLIVVCAGVGVALICSMYAYELFKFLVVLAAFYLVVTLLIKNVIGMDVHGGP